MNAETISILKEHHAEEIYCPICYDVPPHCYCDEIDYEAEEHHVWDFYEALGNEDFEKAADHLERIRAVWPQ